MTRTKTSAERVTKPKPAKRGRKPGQKTEKADYVAFVDSRCKRCDSTERMPYFGTPVVLNHSGTAPDGKPFTTLVRKRTRCLNPECNQLRIDTTYRYSLQ